MQATSCYEYVANLIRIMADNYREETTTRKRGRAPSKLSVKLFLLDPDKNITKVTKEIGSEKGLNELKQKGYGPPSKGKYTWLIQKILTIPLIMFLQTEKEEMSEHRISKESFKSSILVQPSGHHPQSVSISFPHTVCF